MQLVTRCFLVTVALAACGRNASNNHPDASSQGDAPNGKDAPAGPTTSEQIAGAKAAADGAIDLAIDGATVTYVVPAVGMDPAGVFVQADQSGPALFLAVDPTTLSPAPAAGDVVSFHVTMMATQDGQRRAAAVASWQKTGTASVTGLVRDVSSATDLVSNLDGYDSTLVALTATATSGFTSAAMGHVAATIDTAGMTGATGFKFRLPTTLRASMDLAQGCVLHIGPTPLWRFTTTAEPSAWVAGDVSVTSCPAPKVVSAAATAPTTVVVTFDRVIDPASVMADGSQFTFDQSLAASAATASGNTVTITTGTTTGITYNVTVASTVKDIYASGVTGTTSTSFVGFQVVAQLAIDEVNANIASSHDLVELVVVSAGTINGIKLAQDVATPITLATLPNLQVAQGDLIVVHLAPVATTTETATKADCSDAACFAGAWDVNGGTAGITFSNRVLQLLAPDNSVMDVVPFAKAGSSSPTGFPTDLQTIQGGGHWMPANCGGMACTYMTTPSASDATISVDWTALGTSASGTSAQRKPGQFTKTAADWHTAAASFGAANP